jgi:hypothetical protein
MTQIVVLRKNSTRYSIMDIRPVFGEPAGDSRAVFLQLLSQSVLASVRSSTLAPLLSFSVPLPPQPAALAEGAPVGMKMGYQVRDKHNEGGEAVGEGRRDRGGEGISVGARV